MDENPVAFEVHYGLFAALSDYLTISLYHDLAIKTGHLFAPLCD